MNTQVNKPETNVPEIIKSINYALHETEKAMKYGDGHALKAYKSQKKLELERAKAVTRLSSGADQTGKAGKKAKGKAENKPTLQAPTTNFTGFSDQAQSGQTMGLIAIIGEVMAMQAKTNSNSWKTFFDQSFQSMMQSVKMAPVIGNAIKNSFDAQANSKLAQASMSETEAIISLSSFALTIGGTAFAEFKEAKTAGDEIKNDGIAAKDETVAATNDTVTRTTSDAENNRSMSADASPGGTNMQNTTKEELLKAEEALGNKRTSRLKAIMENSKKAQTKLGTFFRNASGIAQTMTMANQGALAINNSQGQTKQAYYSKEEGKAQAFSKQAESYQQFYNQSVSRTDALTQGSQQNVDYAMNILKSAADTITQTTTAMFRG